MISVYLNRIPYIWFAFRQFHKKTINVCADWIFYFFVKANGFLLIIHPHANECQKALLGKRGFFTPDTIEWKERERVKVYNIFKKNEILIAIVNLEFAFRVYVSIRSRRLLAVEWILCAYVLVLCIENNSHLCVAVENESKKPKTFGSQQYLSF